MCRLQGYCELRMSSPKLFLLDAMALIYRAHFAFIKNPRITSKGVNTSAVFGFTNALLEVIQKERPTHLAVVFDTAAPTFRHLAFTDYKAHRDEVPEDIIVATPLIKRLLKAMQITSMELDGYEADDIIGTVAHRAAREGYQVYMMTPDKDYAQLVQENIWLYRPASMGNGVDVLDRNGIIEKYGIAPERVADFLGMKGDKVDNIPGIPKIGDKTALELLSQFGSLEEIIRRCDEIQKPSIRDSVREFAEQGILSKQLATIHTNVPIEFAPAQLQIVEPHKNPLIEILNELEFRTTAQRILTSGLFPSSAATVQRDLFGNTISNTSGQATGADLFTGEMETIATRKHTYTTISELAGWRSLVHEIQTAGRFCFDTETTGLDAMAAELVALSISIREHEAYCIFFPSDPDRCREILAVFAPVFSDPQILKVGQNIKYDMLVLSRYGIAFSGPYFDTMLAHYVIDPDKPHNMDAIAQELLGYTPVSITTLIGRKGKGQLSMRDVDADKLRDYACEDADITLSFHDRLEKKLEGKLAYVFTNIEQPLMPVLASMEMAGIRVDTQALKDYSAELQKEIQAVEQQVYELAGLTFNIQSPRQLGDILFEKLQLGGKAKKTKTGQYVTDEETLSALAGEHPFPGMVLRFRQLSKLKSTYVDALPALVNSVTGRVHSTFSQTVANTGRLSSNNPNLQNIPIRTDEGKEIRRAFIPANKDFVLLSADYSQVELRLMAHMSQDPSMIAAFREGKDIHRATAAKVFGVEPEAVTTEMRSRAKMVNFGIIYGISAFGLAQRLGISRTEAKSIIDAYFENFPRVKEYMDSSIAQARTLGYAETLAGRRRYLPDLHSQNQTIRGFAERNAINMPVQGTAADLIKLAMIRIHGALREENLQSRMLLQVHDELVFEVHRSELTQVTALVRHHMEHAMEFLVPMETGIGTGENWLEAH